MKKIVFQDFPWANAVGEKTSVNSWHLRSFLIISQNPLLHAFQILSFREDDRKKGWNILSTTPSIDAIVLLAFYALFQVIHGRDGFVWKRLPVLCGRLVDLVVHPVLNVLVDGHLVQTKAQRRGRRLEASQEEHEHLTKSDMSMRARVNIPSFSPPPPLYYGVLTHDRHVTPPLPATTLHYTYSRDTRRPCWV